MIEAEARLQANVLTGMMTILNALRAAPSRNGTYQPTALAALPVPATKDAAVSLYFLEKAFWTFGRGPAPRRLASLDSSVSTHRGQRFPTGLFHKNNVNYLKDVNLPVTDTEKTNPNFTGCLDRNA